MAAAHNHPGPGSFQQVTRGSLKPCWQSIYVYTDETGQRYHLAGPFHVGGDEVLYVTASPAGAGQGGAIDEATP